MRIFRTLTLTALMLSSTVAFAKNEDTTMEPIIEKTQSIVELMEGGEYNQEVVRIEMDLLFSTKETIRTLTDKYTYTIIAYGDDRFKDIDVAVYRRTGSGWAVVEKDADDSSLAVVTVTPSTTGEYKIEIIAREFEKGYTAGHYGLIICHDME